MTILTLRPNAAGSECNIPEEGASPCPNHYQNVDEVSQDGFTTWIGDQGASPQPLERDLYGCEDHTSETGTINSVKILAYARRDTTTGYYRMSVRTNGVSYNSSEIPLTGASAFILISNTWAVNPQTSSAWTWAEVDAMEIGGTVEKKSSTSNYYTQIYAEVDYTSGPTNYDRSASVIIGAKVTASRLLGTDRDSLVKIGVLVTATELYQLARVALVLIGIVVFASYSITISRVSSVIVGILVTATKTVQRNFVTASVIIGMVVSASRLLSTSQTSLVIVGIVAMASRAITNIIASSVIVGVVVSATRIRNITRISLVLIGIVPSALRVITSTRNSLVIVGVVATASKVITTIRSSTVVVGIVATATKTIAIIRQSSVMVGIVVSVNFFKENVKRTFPRFVHPFRGLIPNAPTSSKKTIRNRRAE